VEWCSARGDDRRPTHRRERRPMEALCHLYLTTRWTWWRRTAKLLKAEERYPACSLWNGCACRTRRLCFAPRWQRDDGRMEVFLCYRVQHNDMLARTRAGYGWTAVDLEEVKALALWMTMKTALANPVWRGQGRNRRRSRRLSKMELERLIRNTRTGS